MKPPRPLSARVRARPRHVFKIVFDPCEAGHTDPGGASFGGRTVIVEVEETVAPPVLGRAREAARAFAAEAAHGAALQAVQKDLPHGVEPTCSVTPLESLPDAVAPQRPALYTSHARAWLA